jgi:hypothetical protein
MATRIDSTSATEASGLAFERFRDALEGRATGYPKGAIFVPSDAAYTQKTLLRALREGQPAVVVFPDGQERIVRAEPPESSSWFSAMSLWVAARRRARA